MSALKPEHAERGTECRRTKRHRVSRRSRARSPCAVPSSRPAKVRCPSARRRGAPRAPAGCALGRTRSASIGAPRQPRSRARPRRRRARPVRARASRHAGPGSGSARRATPNGSSGDAAIGTGNREQRSTDRDHKHRAPLMPARWRRVVPSASSAGWSSCEDASSRFSTIAIATTPATAGDRREDQQDVGEHVDRVACAGALDLEALRLEVRILAEDLGDRLQSLAARPTPGRGS